MRWMGLRGPLCISPCTYLVLVPKTSDNAVSHYFHLDQTQGSKDPLFPYSEHWRAVLLNQKLPVPSSLLWITVHIFYCIRFQIHAFSSPPLCGQGRWFFLNKLTCVRSTYKILQLQFTADCCSQVLGCQYFPLFNSWPTLYSMFPEPPFLFPEYFMVSSNFSF